MVHLTIEDMKKIISMFIIAGIYAGLASCYYDIEEELYPSFAASNCDTLNISFSQDIEPILINTCYTCHGSGIGLGGVTLEGFSNLQNYIADGSLLGSIEHSSGFTAMPSGGNKLGACSINKFRAWINQGAINN